MMLGRAGKLLDWASRSRPWRTFSHFVDSGGNVLSGGMSYQALFAVFAGLWLGFGVLGIVLRGQPAVLEALIAQVNELVPGLLQTSGSKGAVDPDLLLSTRAFDWSSGIAALALLWVSVNWFTGTRRSIRIVFGLEVKDYNSPLLLKLRDLVLALLFSALLLVSTVLTLLSSSLTGVVFGWLSVEPTGWFFSTLGNLVRYAAMWGFDVFVLYAMHRYLAEVRPPRVRLLQGCLLGAGALLALKILGAALLGSATSNPLLAPFAVLVGLLIWFNLICRVLLLTSAWIATGLDPERGQPEPRS